MLDTILATRKRQETLPKNTREKNPFPSPRRLDRTRHSLLPAMSSSPLYDEKYHSDNESGYASADSSQAQLPEIFFSKPHLKYINQQLAHLEPEGTPRRAAKRRPLCTPSNESQKSSAGPSSPSPLSTKKRPLASRASSQSTSSRASSAPHLPPPQSPSSSSTRCTSSPRRTPSSSASAPATPRPRSTSSNLRAPPPKPNLRQNTARSCGRPTRSATTGPPRSRCRHAPTPRSA